MIKTGVSDDENPIKILIAHPGRQHSFRLATALKHYGMLSAYVTTVYNKDTSILMKMCKRILSGDALKKAEKRKCPDVGDEQVIQFCEAGGLFYLLLLRVDKSKHIAEWYRKTLSVHFQKKVARYIIKNDVDIVISYDCNSKVLYEILRKEAPNVIRIMDNAAPCRNYLYKTYREGDKFSGEFRKTYYEDFMKSKEIAEKYSEEVQLADLHIVASSFAANALRYNGINDAQILIVPYGVNQEFFVPDGSSKKSTAKDILKVLFVGEINQRKGIYQVLEAAKYFAGKDVEFTLVGGGKEVKEELYSEYEQYVNFRGVMIPEELSKVYEESDIFIFPTQGDGFGLVILEALSAGLPVISSTMCAGADIIVNGYNGFLIDAYSKEALIDRIGWFNNHRSELPKLSMNARNSVKQYTWDNYERNLVIGLADKIQSIRNNKRNEGEI